MKNIKIIFFGTPEYIIPISEQLNRHFNLVAVVTNPDKPSGRDQVLTPSPVKLAAQKLDLAILTPDKLDQEFINQLRLFHSDLGVVASYGKIIPEEVLEIPKFGLINIHPSLLPKYRGASPIQNAILAGDNQIGVSIIQMDQEMDHGPILAQITTPISLEDTFESMSKKLFQQGTELLIKIIPDFISGKIKLQTQDHSLATYTWKTSETKHAAFFDLSNPPDPKMIDQMTRAFYPWPNAWTLWNDKIIKFYPERKIQMEGKKIINWEEFLRGYPDFPLPLLRPS